MRRYMDTALAYLTKRLSSSQTLKYIFDIVVDNVVRHLGRYDMNKLNDVSTCKKCGLPKPPRTHHCRICKRCTLKMDHHCPWLNNCIGHYNHRYFVQFCVFTSLGTTYLAIAVWPLFYEEYFATPEHSDIDENGVARFQISLFGLKSIIQVETFLSSVLMVVLTGLALYHVRSVTRGETSIEVHINRKQSTRLKTLGCIYQNPYDFGPLENWRKFLGLRNKRRFWSHILIPSGHPPDGNGYQWDTNYDKNNIHIFSV
ncbi:palmitoyltransferase ZDHHC16-like [Glandiceps talaboti]